MKKNNAIAFIGYIGVTIAPFWGITGVIIAIALLMMGARTRQAMGVLITGLISVILEFALYDYRDVLYSMFMAAFITFSIGMILYYFTLEEK